MAISNDRSREMIDRCSVVSAGLIALFWGVWYWFAGSVPEINIANLSISHWWDIILGPLFTCLMFSLVKILEGDESFLIFGSVFLGSVLGASTIICMEYTMKMGLFVSIVAGLFFGIIAAMFIPTIARMVIYLLVCLIWPFCNFPRIGSSIWGFLSAKDIDETEETP